ncbi:hypothetical protein B6S59_31150 [Pseudomonas sp. A46]|nr:hypothetical protein B6S59_31150 [Pseudomonas sp. A46]
MQRRYMVLYVDMTAERPEPREQLVQLDVSGLTEIQVEDRLLSKAKRSIADELGVGKDKVAVHAFWLLS